MLLVLVLMGALAALASAGRNNPVRREVKGRSGRVWFTHSGLSPTGTVAAGSQVVDVFASSSGNDIVLKYEAKGEARRALFVAPSSLGQIALLDFVGGT